MATPSLLSELGSWTSAQIQAELEPLRARNVHFAAWAKGVGVLVHQERTQLWVARLEQALLAQKKVADSASFYRALEALDVITNQAMWLVVHMTYAQKIYLDGRDLPVEDFKLRPRGYTGGALNMVPAFAALHALNHFSQFPHQWIMGQGHSVAAVDALQILTGTALPERRKKYAVDEAGLSRFVADCSDYRIGKNGRRLSNLGAHVNAWTAGARMEGGYLGFASMQYAHMPLPSERLVAFLSDGAFEEQRGGDWAPRWWRGEDTGLVAPVMIANGQRIDQRTAIAQQGGLNWFLNHLRNQGFAPFVIDGRDPAAFLCAMYFMEEELAQAYACIQQGEAQYPVVMPYCIAETVKGYGFPGAGTDAAYNLPLGAQPQFNSEALAFFHQGAKALFQPQARWQQAVALLSQPRQKLPPMLAVNCPEPEWGDRRESPMNGIDRYFIEVTEVNPSLRVRVGNSDELRSNGMNQTLDQFRHRVTQPEIATAEAIDGAVITALNEEAVVSACLANQAGINIVVAYEAFAIKMLRALHQTLVFARQQKEAGDPAEWLGFPVITTALIWENGQRGQSHQDASLSESLMLKMSDMVRVVFPADANSAMACLRACYGDLGVIWNLVVPRSVQPVFFNRQQATQLVQDGALCVRGHCGSELQLVATGAVQLAQLLKASDRLRQQRVAHSLIYLLEPGRFREARDHWEAEVLAADSVVEALFPARVRYRLFVTHCRPELVLASCRKLDLGSQRTRALGYINHGATLDCAELLFANKCTWAHALAGLAELCGQKPTLWLTAEEAAAIAGDGDPYFVI